MGMGSHNKNPPIPSFLTSHFSYPNPIDMKNNANKISIFHARRCCFTNNKTPEDVVRALHWPLSFFCSCWTGAIFAVHPVLFIPLPDSPWQPPPVNPWQTNGKVNQLHEHAAKYGWRMFCSEKHLPLSPVFFLHVNEALLSDVCSELNNRCRKRHNSLAYVMNEGKESFPSFLSHPEKFKMTQNANKMRAKKKGRRESLSLSSQKFPFL